MGSLSQGGLKHINPSKDDKFCNDLKLNVILITAKYVVNEMKLHW